MRRALGLLLLLAFTCGCGTPRLSVAEFRHRADAICARYARLGRQTPAFARNAAEARAHIRRSERLFARQTDELAALRPPAAYETSFRAWIGSQRRAHELVARYEDTLVRQTTAPVARLLLRNLDELRLRDVRRLATKYAPLRRLASAMERRHVTRVNALPESLRIDVQTALLDAAQRELRITPGYGAFERAFLRINRDLIRADRRMGLVACRRAAEGTL